MNKKLVTVVMPTQLNSKVIFKSTFKQLKSHDVVYADFEAILVKPGVASPKAGVAKTTKQQEHKICSYGYVVQSDGKPTDLPTFFLDSFGA